MKRFGELTSEEFKAVVLASKSLREELDEYVQECEFDFLSDKISCFNLSVADWSMSFYGNNYFYAKNSSDNYDFEYIDCIQKSVDNFGCSDKLEKLLNQCRKLLGTNLYMHHVKRLYDLYFKEELEPIIDDVEAFSYNLHCGELNDNTCYLDEFQENYSKWLYDSEAQTFYKPCKIAN